MVLAPLIVSKKLLKIGDLLTDSILLSCREVATYILWDWKKNLIYFPLYSKLSSARNLIGSQLWSIKRQKHRWRQRSIQIWQLHDSLNQSQFFAKHRQQITSKCCVRVCQSGEIWNKKAFFTVYFNSLLHKTNRFHVAVRLFSNRSQRTSKCGKNISTFLFLTHFDVIDDLLLNRRTATWNLFVNHSFHLDRNGFVRGFSCNDWWLL